METKQIALEYLHNDHRKWKDELEFHLDEIKFFEHRLESIVGTSDNKEVLANVEHFQNQCIREKEVIDELLHEIKVHEQELGKLAQDVNYVEDDYQVKNHVELGDRMLRFNELFADLKKSFNRFYVNWISKQVN